MLFLCLFAYGKETAKEFERQLAYNLSDETIKKITLQQLYDEYIAVKKFEVRENSMRTIIGRLELYVLPKFKDYKLNKITSSELQKWKQYIETCTNAKKPKEKLLSSMKHPPKSKQNYPNNQQEVYMNGISMYFLISHSIQVCVKVK